LQPAPGEGRLEVIDLLRGVAIVEMLAAHYEGYFPVPMRRVIDYTETAMPLFVLLAGFMVGWGHSRFERDPRGQTAVVWKRALRVLIVQYIMILTLGVPLFLLGKPGVGDGQTLGTFIFQSVFFLNQIGLLHILPTFIPLFLAAPVILYALSRGWDRALLFSSATLFAVGHFHPHLLDLGQPTIFPFILFQLYFVVGCKMGKMMKLRDTVAEPRPRIWALASLSILAISQLIAHSKVLPPHVISTHPLNFFGLLYQVPLLATLWFGSISQLPTLKRLWGYGAVCRFGRHPLLSFVIHVYLATILAVINYLVPLISWGNYALIFLSVLAMDAIVKRYERVRREIAPPMWARTAEWLFK